MLHKAIKESNEGDVIEVEIQKIGKLRNQIVSDARN